MRVLAGAGTGKTRAITHRIAYGVATGVYEPTEVLAVTFTTRAAGEMRTRLRQLGAGGVQARTFHSAALRQLRYFWPHVHGTELPTLTESKLALLAGAARRSRVAADQALLRDLASEIEWAKVSNVHPDDYARVAAARGRSVAGHDPETVAQVFSAYEDVKRSQGRMDMEDVLLFTAGLLADDERVAAQVRRQYKRFVVDEFQDVSPLQSALLDLWLGGRDELCVVGDPAQTIYSFAGARADYLRDFPREVPRHDLDRAGPQLPLHAPGRRRRQPAARRHRQPGRRAARPAARRPRGRLSPATPTRSPRPPPSPTRSRGSAPPGRPPGEIAVLFRINAQSEAHEEALAERGIPYVVRGAARFFDRPEVRQAVTLLRGTARVRRGRRRDLVETVRATLSRAGLDDRGADRPRPGPRPLGVVAGPGRPGDRVRRGRRRPTSAASSTTSTGAPPSSTPRSPTASPSPPSTPPRASSGTPCSSPALQDGTLPFTLRRHPRRGRGGAAAALRRDDPRPLGALALLEPGPQPRRPAVAPALAVPDRAAARERAPAPAGPAVAGPSTAASAASRSSTPAQKKIGRCADCPASYDEELFERLREWRKTRAGEDERAGLRGLHRRHPAADRRAQARRRAGRC